jgi:prolyl oligopeptidase PreP (S9A serine peptidase family)
LFFGLAACGGGKPISPPPMKPTPLPDTARSTPEGGGTASTTAPAGDDKFLWLEEVTGDKALGWVKDQNARSQQELEAAPGFEKLRQRLLAIYDSKARIPGAVARGKWLYNIWKDEANPRGLWRRTTLAEYKKKSPKWETVIDLDALAKAEGENWVWHGSSCLYPDYKRCLISLSRGGADADVVREFDTVEKKFVDGGFALPEAKTEVGWKDLDTIYVGTDFGPGSLTSSGYPRIVKEWKRGTPLSEARTLFEGKETDVSVGAYRDHDHGKVRDWVYRSPSFFTNEVFLLEDGKPVKLEKPDDASAGVWNDNLIVSLRKEWKTGDKTWPAGALLITPFDDFRAGKRDFTMLFEPTPRTSLQSYSTTKNAILVVELEDVKSRVEAHQGRRARGRLDRRRRVRRAHLRRLLVHRDRLHHADHALARQHQEEGAGPAQAEPDLLRGERHRGDPALRGVEGRHARPVLPGRAQGPDARRQQPDDPRRLRRLRDLDDARLQRHRRRRVARARRRARDREHPRRR